MTQRNLEISEVDEDELLACVQVKDNFKNEISNQSKQTEEASQKVFETCLLC